MEQAVLVSIGLFLLVQAGCLIWILSDLTTRTKLTALDVNNICKSIAGMDDRFVTAKEIHPEIGNIKDTLRSLHTRVDNIDPHNCRNFEPNKGTEK